MYRFQVDIHHGYVWTPATRQLIVIYKEKSFDVSALPPRSQARYFYLLLQARVREGGDPRGLCEAFIRLFAVKLGTREAALESIALFPVNHRLSEGKWAESLQKTAQNFVDDVFLRGDRVFILDLRALLAIFSPCFRLDIGIWDNWRRLFAAKAFPTLSRSGQNRWPRRKCQ